MENNEIDIKVIAKDLASQVLKEINDEIKETGKQSVETGKQSEKGFGAMTAAVTLGNLAASAITKTFSILTDIVMTATSTIIEFGKSFIQTGIQTSAQLETNEKGFITLLGSAEKAEKTMNRIKQEAARTPFEIPGLTSATQLLSAVTKDGDEAIDILLDVGESLAAMGKGQAELDRIMVNLQQVGAIGRASMMDIKQFAFAGIPIFEMLQEETGLAGKALEDFIGDGKVTFELLTDLFDKSTKEGGRFFGAFKNQGGTFNQLMSNMQDNINIFASDFVNMSGIFDIAKMAMNGFNEVMNIVSEVFFEWSDAFRQGFNQNLEGIGIAFGKIQESLSPLIPNLEASSNWINDNEDAASLLGDTLGGFVAQALERVNDFLSGFIANKDVVIEALTILKDSFMSTFGALATSQEEAMGKTDEFSVKLGSDFATSVADTTKLVAGFIQQLGDPNSEVRKMITETMELAKEMLNLATNIGDVIRWAGNLGRAFQDAWNNIPGPLKQALKSAGTLGIQPTSEFIGNVTSGKDIGSSLKQFLGFSNGGDFVVPSGFPNDSFPMFVESGERVQVTPKGGGVTNNKNSNVTLNINNGNELGEQGIVSLLSHYLNIA